MVDEMSRVRIVLLSILAGSGCSLIGPPPLPKEGIVAVAGGGEDHLGGRDRLTGTLRFEDGCVTVTPSNGKPVVPVFRSGAAEVDGEPTELRWKGKTYADGSRISLDGDMPGSFFDLPNWTDYFIPGGCLHFKRAMLVNHLPE
jgi:hypothetical protein